MIGVTGVHPWLFWGGFLALICFLLYIDLFVFHKKTHAVSMKEACAWAAVWVIVALLFNLFIWLEFSAEAGLQFLTGYLIEKSLSVDNLFVMVLIFTSFGIAPKYQHRILFWGILGVLVLRGILIIFGSALVNRFEWLFFLFGLFLIYSGIKMFFESDKEEFDHEKSVVVRTVRKVIHVTKKDHDGKFFVKENGKWAVTVLFIALLVVEFTDVIFAFDSIPAIFAITTDPFLVFTSNVFAILGLRSLYFVVAKAHELFTYLKVGLALILVLIGVKLFFKHWWEVPVGWSLAMVAAVLGVSIAASLLVAKRQHAKAR